MQLARLAEALWCCCALAQCIAILADTVEVLSVQDQLQATVSQVNKVEMDAAAANALMVASQNAQLRRALSQPAVSACLLRELAAAEFLRGNTPLSVEIFQFSVVFMTLAVGIKAEAVLMAEICSTEDHFLRDMTTIGNLARTAQSQQPWPLLNDRSTFSVKTPSLAIVSLCEYDPMNSPLTALSASNKLRYTQKHGYKLFFETKRLDYTRPPAWSKVKILKKYLHTADWVAWVDCDSYFMDDSKAMTDLIPDLRTHPTAEMIISKDGLSVNTGVFMLRNSAWSYDFLDVWHGPVDSPFVHHPHWEQGAFVAMMAYSLWHSGVVGMPPIESCQLGMDPSGNCGVAFPSIGLAYLATAARVLNSLHARVVFHPQRWMNSYTPELAYNLRDWSDTPCHTKYTEGDFIVSFSGCVYFLKGPRCNAMYESYYEAAERLNNPAHVPAFT